MRSLRQCVKRKTFKLLLAFLLTLLLLWSGDAFLQWTVREPGPSSELRIGATFIKINAEHIGLDWQAAYQEIIDDIGIRHIRIPIFWDQLEREPGQFDWTDLDWQMQQAEKSDAKVMLAVGHRVPRYPECYAPDWTEDLSEADFKRSLFSMTETVVQHFKDSPALDAWQVENEPLAKILGTIWGGEHCREISQWVKEEVQLVKRLDGDKPTIVTYAFTPWLASQLKETMQFGSDVVAITLFNKVFFRSPIFNGYVEMFKLGPLAPLRLAYQRALIKRNQQDFWVAEMQAEPWGPKGPYDFDNPDDADLSMNPERLRQTWDYAARSGASRIYLWGAEWWLAERNKGKPMMLEAVKAKL